MFVSLSAVAIATVLSFGSAPAELPSVASLEAGSAAGSAPASEAVAPTWRQLWVGEYFEQNILDTGDGRAWSYRVAAHSLLPKGLELDETTGIVRGVPEEEIVQLTTFIVTDDETGAEYTEFEFFRVDNPVRGEPVPEA
jgi:hypothetical protein